MAGTFGYFLQGLSGGLQTGFNMRMNKMEMDWKKKEKEKLEKAQQDLVEKSQAINSKITEYGSDGYWSENEIMDVNTMVLAGGAEIQSLFKQTMSDIKLGRRDAVNQDFSLINSWSDVFDNLSLEDIDSTYKEMSSYITTPEGKKYLNANVSIKKKKAQAMASQPAKQVSAYDFYSGSPATVQSQIAQSVAGQTPGLEGVQFQEPTPTATSTATMPNYNTAINFLSKFTNPDVFEKQKNMIQKNTGLDLSGVTFESLKTPEKVVTPTPKVQDANEVLFGTNGIMKNYINSGSQLGDQQKAEIRNNYDIIKPSLTANVKTQVEEYLKQIGIDVNAPVQAQKDYTTMSDEELSALPNDSLAVEELKNRKPSGGFHPITAIKNWLGQKGGQGVSPTGNVAASSVNQQQNYTTMSDDQLADLALTGDQAAIDELKRRGLL